MRWSDAVVNGLDVTGTVTAVLAFDGARALVTLDSGVRVVIPTSHRPALGDAVVEGELER